MHACIQRTDNKALEHELKEQQHTLHQLHQHIQKCRVSTTRWIDRYIDIDRWMDR